MQWATCSLQCKEGTIFLVPESGASCENMFLPLEKKKKENVQGDQSQTFELLSQNFNYPIQTFEYAEILR